MSEVDYTYAVARTRALEVSLFTQSIIDQLMAMKTYGEALSFILDKGWGSVDAPQDDAETILAEERKKIWRNVRELGIPMDVFDVLSYPNVYHNLKTAIKELYMNVQRDEFYFEDTVPSRKEIRDIVAKKEFMRLPKGMDTAAAEAYETMMHTGNGQMCDVIIDRACLKAIDEAGEESGEDMLRSYAEVVVATADIKIAVRCQKTGKSAEFTQRAMAPSRAIDVGRLAKAAASGFDAICEFLNSCGYGDAAEALTQSPSAFERWCDDYLMEMLRPQKYEMFSVGPVVAYVLARENEIKTVGIILSGKLNGLSDESIRERIRKMYV